jgi:hypothetical protein
MAIPLSASTDKMVRFFPSLSPRLRFGIVRKKNRATLSVETSLGSIEHLP